MHSFDELMHADRVANIGNVMPELGKYVQKSDTLILGLDSDNLFPYTKQSRPVVKVMDVQRDSLGNVELAVKDMSSGDMHMIPKNNVNPALLWQFEPKTFEDVMERSFASTGPSAASAAVDSPTTEMSYAEMASQMKIFEQALGQLANEAQERSSWDVNVTRALDRMSKDMQRLANGEKMKFAPQFHAQYAEAMSNSSDSSQMSELSQSESSTSSLLSLSDSMLSDSLSESGSSTSSASQSSEGSAFALNLLDD